MKRLAAVAVMIAWFSCGALAQRGGSHGGFSGSRSGFSGSHAGFSAPAGGFSGHGAPVFRSGFSGPRSGFRPAPPGFRPAPSGFGGPARFAPGQSYAVRAQRPAGGPRMPSGSMQRMPASSLHRAPYHSPYGHNGYRYPHNHVVFVNRVWPWRFGYPYGWGYPYLWPSIFDDSDSYDSQPDSNYAAQQQPSDYDNGPYEPQPGSYEPQPDDQVEPAPREPAEQPNASRRTPYGRAQSAAPAQEGAVILVFKDGRPSEHIYNYLMTSKTLTVLDQNRRVIPLDQIDLDATAKASIQSGVDFSVPIPSFN